jgi:hypothetical protein
MAVTFNNIGGGTLQVDVKWDGTNWVDITADIRFLSCSSPRRSGTGLVFQPGSFSMTLDDRLRKYDPSYTSGTYYPNIKPGKQVRVRVTPPSGSATPIWGVGFIDRFTYDYNESNKDATCTVTCVDALSRCATAEIAAGDPPGVGNEDTPGERLEYLLATAMPGATEVVEGASYGTQYSSRASITWDASRAHNLLDELQRLSTLEQGPLISYPNDTSSTIEVLPRYWFKTRSGSATAQATFGQPSNFPFYQPEMSYNPDGLVTSASASDELGNTTLTVNAAAVTAFGRRPPAASFDGLPAICPEILSGVTGLVVGVNGTEQFALKQMRFTPGANAGLWAEIANRKLLDRVLVFFTPLGVGSSIYQEYFIDGISHEVRPAEWVTTWSLQPAAPFDAPSGAAGWFKIGTSLVGGTAKIGY